MLLYSTRLCYTYLLVGPSRNLSHVFQYNLPGAYTYNLGGLPCLGLHCDSPDIYNWEVFCRVSIPFGVCRRCFDGLSRCYTNLPDRFAIYILENCRFAYKYICSGSVTKGDCFMNGLVHSPLVLTTNCWPTLHIPPPGPAQPYKSEWKGIPAVPTTWFQKLADDRLGPRRPFPEQSLGCIVLCPSAFGGWCVCVCV